MRDPRLVEFAKDMRRTMTAPERKLWYWLRGKRFNGIKFRRQNVIGNYIADFYSREAMLVIEVDGDSHGFQHDYDAVREKWFQGMRLRVVRFSNRDVSANMDWVLVVISERVAAPLPVAPRLSLSPKGARV